MAKAGIAAALGFLLAACSGAPRSAPVLGEAYVGPAELKLRGDIPLESPVVATLRHGERVEILQQRRGVFLRVRTPQGAAGWTDARQLLAAEEMAGLKELAERARRMPPQGVATTYGDLRVHTKPSRTAPSFLVIQENDKVDALACVTAPRTGAAREPLIPPAPKKAKAEATKPVKVPKYPPPPEPKPPEPPANWIELSQPGPSPESDDTGETDASDLETKAAPVDNWTLVRTSSGESGWVLTRALSMAIPDEVAQYAEGRRIVSYFSLGEVQDGDETKREWLWTTIGDGEQPYDFDSFRIFVWSLRRHRYETAYIERNLKGYGPVLLDQVELSAGGKAKAQPPVRYPGFSLCVEKADGQRRRREYAFLNPAVRLARELPCEARQPILSAAPSPASSAAPAPAKKETAAQRGKRWFRSIVPRWLWR